jgi:SP family xylose:H+ symportor-like MFS transporter
MFNMHLTEGDHFGHWFTYGLYGIICVIAAVFVWKLVPETKGKTLEDMTQLWRNRQKCSPMPVAPSRPSCLSCWQL